MPARILKQFLRRLTAPAAVLVACAGSLAVAQEPATAPPFKLIPLQNSLFDFVTGLPISHKMQLLHKPPLLRPPFAGAPLDSAKGLASSIKANQVDAKNRVKALKFLGTVDCIEYPESQDVLIQHLKEDPVEDVRLAAAKALGEQLAHGRDKKPSRKEKRQRDTCRGCCREKVMNALSEVAYDADEYGCCVEPSKRVREEAAEALNQCCDCWTSGVQYAQPAMTTPPAPISETPAEAPPEKAAEEAAPPQTPPPSPPAEEAPPEASADYGRPALFPIMRTSDSGFSKPIEPATLNTEPAAVPNVPSQPALTLPSQLDPKEIELGGVLKIDGILSREGSDWTGFSFSNPFAGMSIQHPNGRVADLSDQSASLAFFVVPVFNGEEDRTRKGNLGPYDITVTDAIPYSKVEGEILTWAEKQLSPTAKTLPEQLNLYGFVRFEADGPVIGLKKVATIRIAN